MSADNFHKLPDQRRTKELLDDLLQTAVHREERRLGRALSAAEVEILELQTFEPLWRMSHTLH